MYIALCGTLRYGYLVDSIASTFQVLILDTILRLSVDFGNLSAAGFKVPQVITNHFLKHSVTLAICRDFLSSI